MLIENTLMKGGRSTIERQLRKKKLKFISKILILTILSADVLFLVGFIGYHLYGKWVEANKSIYPVVVQEKQKISPTSIPWIKNKAQCLRSNRTWEDDKCYDSEWSHLF
ncbi:hypothetical protein ACP6PL_13040 [Dapis sp. BLCC M126]|uniref:hypothetical protein n=1 Tax=Dapis sp. BLCC M126 TaxID=3400189 RepID=UPI003CF853B8